MVVLWITAKRIRSVTVSGVGMDAQGDVIAGKGGLAQFDGLA
jgi:hypothetical protein